VLIVEIFEFLHGHLAEIVAKHCVVKVDEFSEVSVRDKGAIRFTEVVSSG
jgi:hypothetical protein